MNHKVVIDTAGVFVSFQTRDVSLAELLRMTYAPFLCHYDPDYKIEINTLPAMPTVEKPGHNAMPAFLTDDHLQIANPHVQGLVRDSDRSGSIDMSADNAKESFGLFFRLLFIWLAGKQDCTLIHASALVKNGRAYLFTGPSGSGKTTIANMIDNARIIHDDHQLLTVQEGRPRIKTLPYMGRDDFLYQDQACFPVEKVFFLHQDSRAYLEPTSSARALSRILTVRIQDTDGPDGTCASEHLKNSLARCTQLVKATRCYDLHFTRTKLPLGIMETA